MAFLNATYDLLSAATGTGQAINWPGGRGAFVITGGTFNGATVKLQWRPKDTTAWLDVDASGDTFVTKTAIGSGNFELPPCEIRANVAGAPTGLNAAVLGID